MISKSERRMHLTVESGLLSLCFVLGYNYIATNNLFNAQRRTAYYEDLVSVSDYILGTRCEVARNIDLSAPDRLNCLKLPISVISRDELSKQGVEIYDGDDTKLHLTANWLDFFPNVAQRMNEADFKMLRIIILDGDEINEAKLPKALQKHPVGEIVREFLEQKIALINTQGFSTTGIDGIDYIVIAIPNVPLAHMVHASDFETGLNPKGYHIFPKRNRLSYVLPDFSLRHEFGHVGQKEKGEKEWEADDIALKSYPSFAHLGYPFIFENAYGNTD